MVMEGNGDGGMTIPYLFFCVQGWVGSELAG